MTINRTRTAAAALLALATIPAAATAQNVPAAMQNTPTPGAPGAAATPNAAPATAAPAARAAPTPQAQPQAARQAPSTPAQTVQGNGQTQYVEMKAIAPVRGVYQKTLLKPRLYGKPDLFLTPAVDPADMTDKEIYDEAMAHKKWRTLVTINGMRW